jgi:hypothetical protein
MASNRKGKGTLQGFGGVTKSNQANLAETLKQVGKIIGTKGVRPVGGNVTGCTGGGKAASTSGGGTGGGGGQDVKLKPIAGGKGIVGSGGGGGGKGSMPTDGNPSTLTTGELGSMGKSGLGTKNVRDMP